MRVDSSIEPEPTIPMLRLHVPIAFSHISALLISVLLFHLSALTSAQFVHQEALNPYTEKLLLTLPSAKVSQQFPLFYAPQRSTFRDICSSSWRFSNLLFADANNNITIKYCTSRSMRFSEQEFIELIGRPPSALRDIETQFAALEPRRGRRKSGEAAIDDKETRISLDDIWMDGLLVSLYELEGE